MNTFQALFDLALFALQSIPLPMWRHNGIGCLQAYIQEGTRHETRIHIWHDSLLAPNVEKHGRMHNHRFHMTSTVVFGTIVHVPLSIARRPTLLSTTPYHAYEVDHARTGSTDQPRRTDGPLYLVEAEHNVMITGKSYAFPRERYHYTYLPKSDAMAVTVVSKHRQVSYPARILVPEGHTPEHAFKSPLPPDRFAHLIDKAITNMGDARLNNLFLFEEDAVRWPEVHS